MNLRQRKYAICFGQLIGMYIRGTMPRRAAPNIISAGGTTLGDPRRVNIDWPGLEAKMALRNLVEEGYDHALEVVAESLIMEPAKTFTVARKKDGEIVGTYTDEAAAQAVIDKAKASKKAALVLL